MVHVDEQPGQESPADKAEDKNRGHLLWLSGHQRGQALRCAARRVKTLLLHGSLGAQFSPRLTRQCPCRLQIFAQRSRWQREHIGISCNSPTSITEDAMSSWQI